MRILLTDTLGGYIEELLEYIDFSSMEQFLNEHFRGKVSISDLIQRVSQDGLKGLDGELISRFFFDSVLYELAVARPIFIKMILFSALFSVFTRMVGKANSYISNMGFLTIYATMMVLLMQSLLMVKDIAMGGLESINTFLKALIPTYAAVLAFSGNLLSAGFFYEIAFGLIYIMERFFQVLLSPMIHIFVLLLFMNQLFDEDRLSGLGDFVEKLIRIGLKLAFAGVIGLSVVQSLFTATKDRVSESVILQGLSAIPGIGNAIGASGEILLSCGMLIKNTVGIIALVVLIVVALVPIGKIACFWLLYHLLAALLMPIGDARICACVTAVARGCDLYLKMVMYSMLFFFILIAMVGMASSFIR